MKYRNVVTGSVLEVELQTDHPASSYGLAVPVVVGTDEAIDRVFWQPESSLTLVIHEDECNGEARAFEAFCREHHPEIRIDFQEHVSGIGSGLFDAAGSELDTPDLWAEYCDR